MSLRYVLLPLFVLACASPRDDAHRECAARRVLEESVDPGGPGAIVGVLRDGTWVCRHVRGLADLNPRTPWTLDTPFALASTAKQFTAACVSTLAHAGKLALDDPIAQHVEGLPRWAERVRLSDLLHHRSGVADAYEVALLADLPRARCMGNDAVLAIVAAQPDLDFEPGSRFAYSNSNYVLLARAVERASGATFARFAREELFEPLGMDDTAFVERDADVPRGAARGHVLRARGLEPATWTAHVVGAGGLWTTLDDLGRWDAHVRHDRRSDVAWSDASPRGRPDLGPYGAGVLMNRIGELHVARHRGGAFGFRTEMVRIADPPWTVICVANAESLDAARMAERIAVDVAGVTGVAEPTEVASELTSHAGLGTWIDPSSHDVWILAARDDHVRASTIGYHLALVPDGDHALVGRGTQLPVRFEVVDATRVRATVADEVLELERASRAEDASPAAAACAGTYRCAALDATIEIVARGETLVIAQRADAIAPLLPFAPVHAGVWVGGLPSLAALRFERAPDGAVRAAIVTSGAARLRFERR